MKKLFAIKLQCIINKLKEISIKNAQNKFIIRQQNTNE